MLGLSTGHARVVQLVTSLSVALLVGWVWGKDTKLPIRAAMIAAAAVVAVPYSLVYDFMISSIAGCWLIRAGCEGGFLPWEKRVLVIVYIIPLFAFQGGMAMRIPFGPFAGALLLLLCVPHAWHAHKDPASARGFHRTR
jgi:alpha-1,2-mannosyltransferase